MIYWYIIQQSSISDNYKGTDWVFQYWTMWSLLTRAKAMSERMLIKEWQLFKENFI
jgi:hypothetical protein